MFSQDFLYFVPRHAVTFNTAKEVEKKPKTYFFLVNLHQTLDVQLKCLRMQSRGTWTRENLVGQGGWCLIPIWICKLALQSVMASVKSDESIEGTKRANFRLRWWKLFSCKLTEQQVTTTKQVAGKWHVLPLLTFAKGPSTSTELCANSGPRKDCWSWIMLPREGSLPKAPPAQYSHWVPEAVRARDLYLSECPKIHCKD